MPNFLHLARFRLTRAILVSASFSALSACASVQPPPTILGPVAIRGIDPLSDNASVYGLYLAGEAALDQGESRAAAFYLEKASAKSPDADFIKERAFAAALIAGEVDRAAVLATALTPPSAGSDSSLYTLGVLTRATVDLADDKAKAGLVLLSGANKGAHSDAIMLLKPWAAALAGDWSQATAPPPMSSERGVAAFSALGEALVLERANHLVTAEAIYKEQAARGGLFALAYGRYLERRGRRAEAVALYDKALARDPTDNAFHAARLRASQGKPAPAQLTLKEGAAQALVGPAALLLASKQGDAGLAYLRLALRLDPHMDEAWILVGDAMDAADDPAAARDAYRKVPTGSVEYATAQGRLALSLQNSRDKAGALAVAQALIARSPNDPQALIVLAGLLRDDARFSEAIQVLDKLIAQTAGDSAAAWRLYYMRGASLERDGKWTAAQSDLRQALKLKPDDPEILNYFGFALADRGEDLTHALTLIQHASLLDPQDGAVIDSLGWVHYRLGEYAQAVHELELAASLDAADPEVNDHLGDAYWRTGRKLEARYQWSRVLTLQPDEARRQSVEGKLANGLTAPTIDAKPAAAETKKP
jgi:Flp pilus assembly protein TadD